MPEDPETDMTPETSLQFEYGSNGAGQGDTVTNVANVGANTKMTENEITNPENHSLPTTPPQKIERIDTNFNQSAMSDINQLTRKDFEKNLCFKLKFSIVNLIRTDFSPSQGIVCLKLSAEYWVNS